MQQLVCLNAVVTVMELCACVGSYCNDCFVKCGTENAMHGVPFIVSLNMESLRYKRILSADTWTYR